MGMAAARKQKPVSNSREQQELVVWGLIAEIVIFGDFYLLFVIDSFAEDVFSVVALLMRDGVC